MYVIFCPSSLVPSVFLISSIILNVISLKSAIDAVQDPFSYPENFQLLSMNNVSLLSVSNVGPKNM